MTGRPRGEVRVLADADQVARAAAAEFARLAREAAGARQRFAVALAGGSTPRAMYALLADPRQEWRSRIPWEAVHFFWGDERHVPPDHPDSNYRMARETLLERVPIPPRNVHRIAAEDPDAEAAAGRYERELREFFALALGAPPSFDLVLLGLGADGHTASLFPGSEALSEERRLVVAPWIGSLGARRITLTPRALGGAAAVVFLVCGASKAAALRDALEGELRPGLLPAQRIRPRTGEPLWLVDAEAAGPPGGTGS